VNTVWTIARNTVGDAVRKRVLLIFLLIAIVLLFIGVALSYFTPREQRTILTSFSMIVLLIFGALIAISLAIFLIPNEMERRTIYSVLSKPVERWQFFAGKVLGGALTVGMMVGLIGAVAILANVAFVRQGRLIDVPILLKGVGVIYAETVLLTIIATTLSLFLSATVNFSVTLFLFIVGVAQDLIVAWTRRGDLPITKWIVKVFYYLMPHFTDFNIIGHIVHPEVPTVNMTLYTAEVLGKGAIYGAIVLILGVLAFDRKEL
jgi:ABC-type transport system involved in multi-copper enzyme maturation permease subunit